MKATLSTDRKAAAWRNPATPYRPLSRTQADRLEALEDLRTQYTQMLAAWEAEYGEEEWGL